MKKTAVWGILLAELIILLCGCKTAMPVKSTSVSSLDSVSQSIIQPEPETRTAVLCMTDINHPVYRIVQLGFVDSARQLGYDWHILGKADATPVEQRLEWFRGVKEYEADGALCLSLIPIYSAGLGDDVIAEQYAAVEAFLQAVSRKRVLQ